MSELQDPASEPTLTPEATATRRLLTCPKCGANYEVRNWTADRAVRCPACSVDLTPPRVDRVLDASVPLVPIGELADGGKPFGRYRLLAQLGRGGMGVVWKALDTHLRRHVAIKGILSFGEADGTQIERFQREARAAAKLRHPNIVTVHDVGLIEGQHYICADFVDGESLDKRMGKAWPVKRALELVRTVAEALQYAHDQGIVHRDVKPANILLDARDMPYLTDFGLAKDARGSDATAITGTGDVLGTPSYMSPEQARGEARQTGPASDQFSLGVVLYELLTGKRPFTAETQFATMRAVAEADPPRPTAIQPKIHRDVETICLKALEKDPTQRYARIGDVAAEIGRYLDGEPILAQPIGSIARLLRKAGRHRAIVIPTAAALLLGGAAAVWAFIARDAKQGEVEARAAQATAEGRLQKGKLVADVFGRWTQLSTTLREMESIWFSSRATAAERSARLDAGWAQVQVFLDGTPGDSASRATALAVATWPRYLVAGRDDAAAWARSACTVDREVPFPQLMLALVLICDSLYSQPLPSLVFGPTGCRLGPPPQDSPERARARAEIERLLAEAASSPVWGREGAGAFRSASAGLLAFQRGDYETADRSFTEALVAPDLRPIENNLRYARAHARCMRLAFADALEDLEMVARERPDQPSLRAFLGDLHAGLASDFAVRGRDPRPALRTAIARYDESADLAPGDANLLLNRGHAWYALAQAESALGGDAKSCMQNARADLDGAVASEGPLARSARINRGELWDWWASVQLREGEDPFGSLDRAVEDFTQVLRSDPDDPEALAARGSALEHLGEAEAKAGRDPRARCESALADLARALAIDPDGLVALGNRANAFALRAEAEHARGIDPGASYDLAETDLRRAIDANPEFAEGMRNLATLCQDRALLDAAAGRDPLPRLDEAIRLLDRALEVRPGDAEALIGRAAARSKRAEAAGARGEDPTAEFDRAVADFDAGLAVNPRHPWARVNRGNARIRRADWEATHGVDPGESLRRALADYEEAIELHLRQADARSGRAAAHSRLAERLLARGEDARDAMDRVLEDLDEALARSPDDPYALYNRAAAWYMRAQADAATGSDPRQAYRKSIADFDAAIQASQGDPEARRSRAAVLLALASAEVAAGADPQAAQAKAMEDLEAALRANPRDGEAWKLKGELFEAKGEIERAVEAYERAYRIFGDSVPDVKARLERARAKLPR